MTRPPTAALFVLIAAGAACNAKVQGGGFAPYGTGGAGGGSTAAGMGGSPAATSSSATGSGSTSSSATGSGATSSSATGSGSTSSGGSCDAGPRKAALPVPPDATHFVWQGVQTAFLDTCGQPCTSRIALAVSDHTVCYASSLGALRCAGSIYTHTYGPAFTDVPGVSGVEQVLLSPTFNAANNQAVCVKTSAGKALCMGSDNSWGQFGNGSTSASAGFVQFGSLSGVVAIATGTWDQMCAVTSSQVFCAGNNFGSSPVSVGSWTKNFWLDGFAKPHIDDPTVFHVMTSRGEAMVESSGAHFEFPPGPLDLGTPGDVVDVTGSSIYMAPGSPMGPWYCWLDGQGAAWCSISSSPLVQPGMPPPPPTQVFTARKVLALAGSYYTTSLCAVYDDGSLACMGDDSNGQLGVSGPSFVTSPVVVQPPGTFDLTCQ